MPRWLRDLLGRTLPRALEQQVLDEVADAVGPGRLVARPDADPQADAHTHHVRHLRRGDRQTVLELSESIHALPHPMARGTIPHPARESRTRVMIPLDMRFNHSRLLLLSWGQSHTRPRPPANPNSQKNPPCHAAKRSIPAAKPWRPAPSRGVPAPSRASRRQAVASRRQEVYSRRQEVYSRRQEVYSRRQESTPAARSLLSPQELYSAARRSTLATRSSTPPPGALLPPPGTLLPPRQTAFFGQNRPISIKTRDFGI